MKTAIFTSAALVAIAVAGTVINVRAAATGDGADIVLYNAKITTMDPRHPTASAIAIKNDMIIGVGSSQELQSLVSASTKSYDVQGRTIIPGLIDSHIHVRDLGFEQYYAVNVLEARSIADVTAALIQRLQKLQAAGKLDGWHYPTTGRTGPWLFGLGWQQDRLVEKRMADRHDLDTVSRDIPISLTRVYDGIAVNTKVFELLGIDFNNPSTYPDWFKKDPADFRPGDVIVRDAKTGLPTGVFLGTKAPRLVSGAVPTKSLSQQVDSLALGLNLLASLGITSIVEPGSSMGRVTRVYQAAQDAGRLPIRVNLYDGWYRSSDPEGLGDPVKIEERLRALGFHNLGDRMFRIRGAKSSADGGIASRSAALSVPYLPSPDDPQGDKNVGVLRDSDENRMKQFELLANFGWEIHTHACGDVAIRQTMNVYKTLMDRIKGTNPTADLRWSIIHDYLPDEAGTSVIADMAHYGVIAVVNPAFLYFQGDSFLKNIGPERMARHTPFKRFLDAKIMMASGSDYPTGSPDPWVGLYSMRVRKGQISGQVFGADQRISLQEALKTYTINGAYLTYEDGLKGSLTVGKLADLAVIDGDLLRAPDDQLLTMASKVVMTMVGGQVKYQKPGFVLTPSASHPSNALP